MQPDCLARPWESPARRRGARSDSLRWLLAVIEKVDADHVQCELARLKADGFAIAGEAYAAFFDAAGVRERDVYRADGFFFRAAAGPSYSRDAQSKRAAHAAPDSVR